jgi:hypothetical protein
LCHGFLPDFLGFGNHYLTLLIKVLADKYSEKDEVSSSFMFCQETSAGRQMGLRGESRVDPCRLDCKAGGYDDIAIEKDGFFHGSKKSPFRNG